MILQGFSDSALIQQLELRVGKSRRKDVLGVHIGACAFGPLYDGAAVRLEPEILNPGAGPGPADGLGGFLIYMRV